MSPHLRIRDWHPPPHPTGLGLRVLCWSTSGEAALALSEQGHEVWCIAETPAIAALIALKVSARRHLPMEGQRALLGIEPLGRRLWLYHRLRPNLQAETRAWWDAHEHLLRAGLVHTGQDELTWENRHRRPFPFNRFGRPPWARSLPAVGTPDGWGSYLHTGKGAAGLTSLLSGKSSPFRVLTCSPEAASDLGTQFDLFWVGNRLHQVQRARIATIWAAFGRVASQDATVWSWQDANSPSTHPEACPRTQSLTQDRLAAPPFRTFA